MLRLYGLNNCDTCKKARRWLEAEGIVHEFHDLRQSPVDAATLRQWLEALGSDKLINRRGTTWRNLSEADKALNQAEDLVGLLNRAPALIKRPVWQGDDWVVVGFTDAAKNKVMAPR